MASCWALPVSETPGFYDSYLLETGWGVLYFGLVAFPLACVAVRVSLDSLIAQVAVAGVAVAVAAVAATTWLQLLPAAGLIGTAVVVGILSRAPSVTRPPRRWRLTRPDSRRRWAMLLIAVTSLPPAALLGWDTISGAREGRPPQDDITWGLDHWPMQAGLALALPLVAALASLELSGWRVTAYTTAAGAAWLGYFSVVYPAHAGSLGRAGGWVALLLATSFLLASLLPDRSEAAGP
ncbi:hypothetical protein [Terrabacter sp. BE26]|uniref:hypothetical protein n=1 Tax=Terrabacter sp. BE26 TaxID=2898152 RepID=UPI0035BE6AAA